MRSLIVAGAVLGLLSGCGEDDSGPAPVRVEIGGVDGRVLDSEYVSRRFFVIVDVREPFESILNSELAIFRTTFDGEADRRNGLEVFPARGSLRGDDSGTVVIDTVTRLIPNEDYLVSEGLVARGLVVMLRNTLSNNQRLYASYLVHNAAIPGQVGNYWSSRSPGDSLSVKVVALTADDVTGGALPSEFIEKALRLERRNVYDLEYPDIGTGGLRLTISRIGGADPTRIDGVPLLVATGLDLRNNRTLLMCFGGQPTSATRGPDGIVDQSWIGRGVDYLIFPDQQPFDPEEFDLVDSESGLVLDVCRSRVIGWELEDPTPYIWGGESYRRVAESVQAVERNGALYRGFRAGPSDARYEITGTYEVPLPD